MTTVYFDGTSWRDLETNQDKVPVPGDVVAADCSVFGWRTSLMAWGVQPIDGAIWDDKRFVLMGGPTTPLPNVVILPPYVDDALHALANARENHSMALRRFQYDHQTLTGMRERESEIRDEAKKAERDAGAVNGDVRAAAKRTIQFWVEAELLARKQAALEGDLGEQQKRLDEMKAEIEQALLALSAALESAADGELALMDERNPSAADGF